jgi:hypothetical protein
MLICAILSTAISTGKFTVIMKKTALSDPAKTNPIQTQLVAA